MVLVLIIIEIQKEKCVIIFIHLNEKTEEKLEQIVKIIELEEEESIVVVDDFNERTEKDRGVIIIDDESPRISRYNFENAEDKN